MTMTYDDILKQYAKGLAHTSITQPLGAGVPTTATVNSGGMTINVSAMQIGTTYPNTIIGFHESKKPSANLMLIQDMLRGNGANASSFNVRLYRAGTLSLTSTGNQFTADSATFPLLRTQFGQANQPIALIPVIQVTTATSVTAPVIQLATSGGGAGYTDQDGNATVGNVNFTFPAAATAVSSWYRLRLNVGDYACRAINQINVVTASTTGAATIWLMELLSPVQSLVSAPATFDALFGSAFMPSNINPAVPTSGSVTSIRAGIATMATSDSKFGFQVAVEAL